MTQTWEIKDFLEVHDGRLCIEGVDAGGLAREHGTPLFVFSERRIRRNIERIRAVSGQVGCPLKVCYAAKAMSTMGILKAVKDAGCDIEVNSGGELWKAIEIGFEGEQIIFNGTSKEPWEIEMAIDAGIYAIQVDSPAEMALIDEIAGRLGKRANVSLRLVPEIGSATHHGLQTALLTSKFGMMPAEAHHLLAQYRTSSNVDLAGIHLHIGSQNPDPSAYSEAFDVLFRNLREFFDETGVRLSHINLGGGFPVDYLSDKSVAGQFSDDQREMFAADFDPAVAIGNAWNSIRHAAAVSGTEHLLDGLTLLLEPGRSIIADAGILLTSVRNEKVRPVDVSDGERSGGMDHWLLTDAGFNVMLSMVTYHWYYHLISAERADEPHDTAYKIAGPLCDGGDVYFDVEGQGRLPEYRLLPHDTGIGEVLALLNCGAYTLAQASQYNGRFLPPVVLIEMNGSARLIRKRDGFGDLVVADLY